MTGRYIFLTSADKELIIFECEGLTEGVRQKILQSETGRTDLFVPNRDRGLFDRSGEPLADSQVRFYKSGLG